MRGRVDLGSAGPLLRRERQALLGAIVLGLAVRIAYVLWMHDAEPTGDAAFYAGSGQLAADGHWLWGFAPYRIPHPTFWKTPGYPLFVGAGYALIGGPTKVLFVQALLQAFTIGLTWLLARRLFGSVRIALAAAFVVAVYPFAWQYTTLLYPEALAIPVVLLVLVIGLDRPPTLGRAAALGLLSGVLLLIRPNSLAFLAAIMVGWLFVVRWPVAVRLGAVAVALAALTLVPWTLRNYDLSGAFVPLSVQDGAVSGTFNDDAANDREYPWAWRPLTTRDRDLFDLSRPIPEAELLHQLRSRAWTYIRAHPSSVVEAAYWNGFRRFWDLRSPHQVWVDAVTGEGGRRAVTLIGLFAYWAMLPFVLLALWRLRARRALLVTLLAMAVLSSMSTIATSGTRYRSTLEPLIVILACSVLAYPRARGLKER